MLWFTINLFLLSKILCGNEMLCSTGVGILF